MLSNTIDIPGWREYRVNYIIDDIQPVSEHLVQHEAAYLQTLGEVVCVGKYTDDGGRAWGVYECGGDGNCGILCLQQALCGSRKRCDLLRYDLMVASECFKSTIRAWYSADPDEEEGRPCYESRRCFVYAIDLCALAHAYGAQLHIHDASHKRGVFVVSDDIIRTFEMPYRCVGRHRRKIIDILADGTHYQLLRLHK